MDWPENLLILLGISLDIFAGMECKGSLLAKIEKKQLVLACAVVSVWQAAALFAGNFLSTLLLKKAPENRSLFVYWPIDLNQLIALRASQITPATPTAIGTMMAIISIASDAMLWKPD